MVGVDGSEDSIHALAWAVEHAARHRLDVEVITMWAFPAFGVELPSTGRVLHEHALEIAEHAVDLVTADRVGEGKEMPSIRVQAYLSHPAHRLVLASRRAELLVVGRGRQSVLGSTSRHVVNHATCPVAVISAPSNDRTGNDQTGNDQTGDERPGDERAGDEDGSSLATRFSVEHPRMARAVETVSQHLSAMGI